jgi:very-short-patch-repair endonuclease
MNCFNNIKFKPQKRFDDCKNTIQLPFDFYLFDYNICIEFDGTYHYQINKKFGGFDRLVRQKENDKIKTKYCHSKGIKLFRIKYTDNLKESVQDILDYIKNKFKNEVQT